MRRQVFRRKSVMGREISPAGNVFTGGSCPTSPCTFYVAKMPTL